MLRSRACDQNNTCVSTLAPTPSTPAATSPPAARRHPRVIEREAGADGAVRWREVIILAPANPFHIKQLAPMLLVPPAAVMFVGLVVLKAFGSATGGMKLFLAALLFMAAMWALMAVPPMLRGLHGRLRVRVTPRGLTVVRFIFFLRWSWTWERWQVEEVEAARSELSGARELRVYFRDRRPLALMTGWPGEHVRAAGDAVRQALADVEPVRPTLRAEPPDLLPYAAPRRSDRVEIRPLADGGVSVTVPPAPGSTVGAVAALCFAVAWLAGAQRPAGLIRTTWPPAGASDIVSTSRGVTPMVRRATPLGPALASSAQTSATCRPSARNSSGTLSSLGVSSVMLPTYHASPFRRAMMM